MYYYDKVLDNMEISLQIGHFAAIMSKIKEFVGLSNLAIKSTVQEMLYHVLDRLSQIR